MPEPYTASQVGAITGVRPAALPQLWFTCRTRYPLPEMDERKVGGSEYSLTELLYLLACLGVPTDIVRSHPVTLAGASHLLSWPPKQLGTLGISLGRDGSQCWTRPLVGGAPNNPAIVRRRWVPEVLPAARELASQFGFPLSNHSGFLTLPDRLPRIEAFADIRPLPEDLDVSKAFRQALRSTPTRPTPASRPAASIPPAPSLAHPDARPARRTPARPATPAPATPARPATPAPAPDPTSDVVSPPPRRAPRGWATRYEIVAETKWTNKQFEAAVANATTAEYIPRTAAEGSTAAALHYRTSTVAGFREASLS